MFDLAQPHPERYGDLMRATERARQLMSAGHDGLVKAGIFVGDPRLLGYVFWATLHGLVVLRLAGKLPETPDFDTIYAEAMRVLVAGARSGAPGLSAGTPLAPGSGPPAGPRATSRPRPAPRLRRRTP
jgi:Tetracyclin repressor-like, C-terminal domain